MRRLRIVAVLSSVLFIAWWWLTVPGSEVSIRPAALIRFSHVYMTSADPQRLAWFYETALGASRVSVAASVLPGLSGPIVLRTPGYDGNGPLLSIALAVQGEAEGPLKASDLGYAHIAFETDDMRAIKRRIEASGGKIISRFERNERAPGLYAQDPDGNIIEIHVPFPTPLTPKTLARTIIALLRSQFALGPAMDPGVRFLHVNINSRNWAKTVEFYRQAISTEPTGFKRNYEGSFISKITGVDHAVVHGRHVALPGYTVGGPTFEIFTYDTSPMQGPLTLSDRGRVATGFSTDDLDGFLDRCRTAGGQVVADFRPVSVLMQDRDGNLFHLMHERSQ